MEEIEVAKSKYATGFLRLLVKLAGWAQVDMSAKKIMEDCDANHDGIFTTEDWMASVNRCVPKGISMCMLKKVCDNADTMQRAIDSPSFMNSLKTWI